jgi:hypothetical protein
MFLGTLTRFVAAWRPHVDYVLTTRELGRMLRRAAGRRGFSCWAFWFWGVWMGVVRMWLFSFVGLFLLVVVRGGGAGLIPSDFLAGGTLFLHFGGRASCRSPPPCPIHRHRDPRKPRQTPPHTRLNRVPAASLPAAEYDNPMGAGTGAAVLFGNSGGVTEAAVRRPLFCVFFFGGGFLGVQAAGAQGAGRFVGR